MYHVVSGVDDGEKFPGTDAAMYHVVSGLDDDEKFPGTDAARTPVPADRNTTWVGSHLRQHHLRVDVELNKQEVPVNLIKIFLISQKRALAFRTFDTLACHRSRLHLRHV